MPEEKTTAVSKGAVNRAGTQLLASSTEHHESAKGVLDAWRANHIAPLNSFQISLRKKLIQFDSAGLVSQRLKRTPSILAKLQRNPQMLLARMQDIGGIRVAPCVRIVVASVKFKYGAAMKEQSGKTRTRVQGSSVSEVAAA
jgi:hypothetical protein